MIWFLIAGWWLTILHIVTGAVLRLTIIGIPLGLAFKLIAVGLRPFGREIVSVEEARAAECPRQSSRRPPADNSHLDRRDHGQPSRKPTRRRLPLPAYEAAGLDALLLILQGESRSVMDDEERLCAKAEPVSPSGIRQRGCASVLPLIDLKPPASVPAPPVTTG
jgi:Inner membrane component domain